MPQRRPEPRALLRRVRSRADAAIRWRAAEVVEPTARRAQDLHDWVARVERTAEWTANEMRRIAPQVAAIESRLADLDDLLRRRAIAEPDDHPTEERALLDTIAAEHERVRVRLAAVASYEERLRRLETGGTPA
ncbi:hypothetical protein [Jatrophihabitans fulvus]